MYAGAALELLAVIIAMMTVGSLKAAILQLHPGQAAGSPPALHATELIWTALVVVHALIALCLWLWMASANEQGRGWARGVSALFFGINTVGLFLSLRLLWATPDLIVTIVIWLVGFAAIVLIFSEGSAPFYQEPARR
jgi:hypothetical protein